MKGRTNYSVVELIGMLKDYSTDKRTSFLHDAYRDNHFIDFYAINQGINAKLRDTEKHNPTEFQILKTLLTDIENIKNKIFENVTLEKDPQRFVEKLLCESDAQRANILKSLSPDQVGLAKKNLESYRIYFASNFVNYKTLLTELSPVKEAADTTKQVLADLERKSDKIDLKEERKITLDSSATTQATSGTTASLQTQSKSKTAGGFATIKQLQSKQAMFPDRQQPTQTTSSGMPKSKPDMSSDIQMTPILPPQKR